MLDPDLFFVESRGNLRRSPWPGLGPYKCCMSCQSFKSFPTSLGRQKKWSVIWLFQRHRSHSNPSFVCCVTNNHPKIAVNLKLHLDLIQTCELKTFWECYVFASLIIRIILSIFDWSRHLAVQFGDEGSPEMSDQEFSYSIATWQICPDVHRQM